MSHLVQMAQCRCTMTTRELHLYLVSQGMNGDAWTDRGPLWRDFLHQLLVVGLIDQRFPVAIDKMISNDSASHLHSEAQDAGVDIEVCRVYSQVVTH